MGLKMWKIDSDYDADAAADDDDDGNDSDDAFRSIFLEENDDWLF